MNISEFTEKLQAGYSVKAELIGLFIEEYVRKDEEYNWDATWENIKLNVATSISNLGVIQKYMVRKSYDSPVLRVNNQAEIQSLKDRFLADPEVFCRFVDKWHTENYNVSVMFDHYPHYGPIPFCFADVCKAAAEMIDCPQRREVLKEAEKRSKAGHSMAILKIIQSNAKTGDIKSINKLVG